MLQVCHRFITGAISKRKQRCSRMLCFVSREGQQAEGRPKCVVMTTGDKQKRWETVQTKADVFSYQRGRRQG
jgi:hypothetical protein